MVVKTVRIVIRGSGCKHDGIGPGIIRVSIYKCTTSSSQVRSSMVNTLIKGISSLRLALFPAEGRVKTTMGDVATSRHAAFLKKLVLKAFVCAIQDDKGKTILHRAVEESQVKMVNDLLGILKAEDVIIDDADGERALDVAVRQGLDDITALLLVDEVRKQTNQTVPSGPFRTISTPYQQNTLYRW